MDLEDCVHEKSFREDLYYRIDVIRIDLPPLRQRREDIPILVEYFTDKFCQKMGIKKKIFSSRAMNILQQYPWPGNIRELDNIIKKTVALHKGDIIYPRELKKIGVEPRYSPDKDAPPPPLEYRKARELFESQYLNNLLQHNDYNILRSARVAGIHPSSLHRKISRYLKPGSRKKYK